MEKKMTQYQAVLEHLKTKGALSQAQAVRLYGCYRLSALIFMFKKMGYEFDTITKVSKNRFGYTTHYAVYKLVG